MRPLRALLWCGSTLVVACGSGSQAPTAPSCYPKMSERHPSGELPAGTRNASLSLRTDRDAVCRWGEIEGVVYFELPHAFEVTGGTQHATPISGLEDGAYYRWYAKCEVPGTSCMTPHDLIFIFHVAGE
jgi:hypothetical protein